MTDPDRAGTGQEDRRDADSVVTQPDPVAGASAGTASAWNVVVYGAGKLVTLVSTLVLARLLAPEAFGLVALALLAVNLFDRFKDLGVGPALVRHPGSLREVGPTGAVLVLATSSLLAVSCFGLAPWISALLTTGDDTAEVTSIVRALAAWLFISGLAILPDVALRRTLEFRLRAVPELAGTVVKAAVSIVLALRGWGAWALVWGQLAGAVLTTSGYAVVSRSRLRFDFGWDRSVARDLVRFGSSLTTVGVLALVLDNLDYFVIGRRLGAEDLGYYTMAFRLPELLVVGVCIVVGQVLFASFSRLQGDRVALARHYLDSTTMVSLLTVPLGVGLAALAPEVVDLMLGPQFVPSVPLLQLLGLYSAAYSLSFFAGEVYKAIDRARILIWVSLVRLVVFAPVLWWAAGHSVGRVALAFLLLHLVFVVVRLVILRSVLALGLGEQLRAMLPPILAAALAFGAASALRPVVEGLPSAARLVSLGVAGAVVYLAVLYAVDRRMVRRAYSSARALVGGRS